MENLINVTPLSRLPISVQRQQAIIDVINQKLAANSRQSFCFVGKPGVGKTFLMKAIQQYALEQKGNTKPVVAKVKTLAQWYDANQRVISGNIARSKDPEFSYVKPDPTSVQRITDMVDANAFYSSYGNPEPRNSIHYFIDEIDQELPSDYAKKIWSTFFNVCYDNSARNFGLGGNSTDIVQLVVAMNASLPEFGKRFGLHEYRRLVEMCAVIDFDREAPAIPPPAEYAPHVIAMNKAIEDLL